MTQERPKLTDVIGGSPWAIAIIGAFVATAMAWFVLQRPLEQRLASVAENEIARADDLLERGLFAEARRVYEDVAERVLTRLGEPSYIRVRIGIGRAIYESAKWTFDEVELGGAESALQEAARMARRRLDSTELARAQMHLGLVYRVRSNIRSSVPMAEEAEQYMTASRVWLTSQRFPQEAALIERGLGNVAITRSSGEELFSVADEALENMRRADSLFQSLGLAYETGATAHDKALIYLRLGEASRGQQWFDSASAQLEKALEVFSLEEHPYPHGATRTTQAAVLYNLGLLSGRPSDFRAATDAGERAVSIFSRERHHVRFAMAMTNLGLSYRELSQFEEGGTSLQRAVEAFEAANEVLSPVEAPLLYGINSNNLGMGFAALYELERESHLADAARRSLRAALEVFTREAYPSQHGQIALNLGAATMEAAVYEGDEELAREARVWLNTAQEIFPEESLPLVWALAEVHTARAAVLQSSSDLEGTGQLEALARVAEALAVLRADNYPQFHLLARGVQVELMLALAERPLGLDTELEADLCRILWESQSTAQEAGNRAFLSALDDLRLRVDQAGILCG